MRELKPCPFCGAQMTFDSRGFLFAWHKQGCFLQLLVSGLVDLMVRRDREAMVAAWNQREFRDEPPKEE